MKKWSKGWIDTDQFKTKGILLFVIGNRVKNLIPHNKAKTSYICICPFHEEKTSSFIIHNNNEKKHWMYKCLSCGRSGDVFNFLMLYERWEFWDALVYIKKSCSSLTDIYSRSDPNQLKIPYPVDVKTGEFIWLSSDIKQIGFMQTKRCQI